MGYFPTYDDKIASVVSKLQILKTFTVDNFNLSNVVIVAEQDDVAFEKIIDLQIKNGAYAY